MHTRITHAAMMIWYAKMAGQLAVGLYAWKRRNKGLALYLSSQFLIEFTLYGVARLADAWTYYRAYTTGQIAGDISETVLLATIFLAIRKTGIPNKNHPGMDQIFAAGMFAVATLTLRFPLTYISYPEWKWIFAIAHVFNYWLCIMLVLAPVYAWMVDSAKDDRLLLIYIGFAAYVTVHAGAIDFAIASHLLKAKDVVHVPDIAYFFSLALWSLSSYFQSSGHQWDPAQTETLKAILASRPIHINHLSRSERAVRHDHFLLRSSNLAGRGNYRNHRSPQGK